MFGHVWRIYDPSGLIETVSVDVDGRVTKSTRRFVEQNFPALDWLPQADGTSDEVFTQTATFDVAGRPVRDAIYRDSAAKHERRYTHDLGGRLTGVEVRIRSTSSSDLQPAVHDIEYNARGQRVLVQAGDDSGGAALQTTLTYAPDTFRLIRLRTERSADTEVPQDFRWVHDATGKVTHQERADVDAVWYNNATVTAHRSYVYDALDRLVEAMGREHTSTFDTTAGSPGSAGQRSSPHGTGPVAHKADGTALRTYTQKYTYDDVGNFTELRHEAGAVTSVRTYSYQTETDGTLFNNQLHSTTVGTTDYDHTYDAHGNTTSLSHLFDMAWGPFDRLQSVQTVSRSQASTPSASHAPAHDWWYVYDGSGQRVRKVKATLVEYDSGGDPGVLVADGVKRQEERLYVGPLEVWRSYHTNGDTSTERETLHVMDDQRRVAMVETLTWEEVSGTGAVVASPVDRWRYQLDDHLGTSVGEVTETGLEIGWEEYHPYGTTALWSFDSSREVSGKRYRFTGMERDDETGLSMHGARLFAPALGRWISVDPQGVEDGPNLLQYAHSLPTSRTDRRGTLSASATQAATDSADRTRAAISGLPAMSQRGQRTLARNVRKGKDKVLDFSGATTSLPPKKAATFERRVRRFIARAIRKDNVMATVFDSLRMPIPALSIVAVGKPDPRGMVLAGDPGGSMLRTRQGPGRGDSTTQSLKLYNNIGRGERKGLDQN